MEFPTDGKPSSWQLRKSQATEWKQLFPHLDLKAECRAALAWIKASPERRKTATGMPRFLVGWFTKAQNSGRRAGAQPANGKDLAPMQRDPYAHAVVVAKKGQP